MEEFKAGAIGMARSSSGSLDSVLHTDPSATMLKPVRKMYFVTIESINKVFSGWQRPAVLGVPNPKAVLLAPPRGEPDVVGMDSCMYDMCPRYQRYAPKHTSGVAGR